MSPAVHVHFSRRMLAALTVLLVAPWLVIAAAAHRGWLTVGSDREAVSRTEEAASESSPASGSSAGPVSHTEAVASLPDGRRTISETVIPGKPGPWGQLSYVPITLSLPDEFIFVPPANQPPVRWVFHGMSKEQAIELLQAAGVPAAEVTKLQGHAKWTVNPAGIALEPGDELLLGLSPDVRAKLYTRLVEFPENQRQIDPVWFRPDRLEEHLKQGGLSATSLELLKGLLYPQGPSLLLFADFEPALRRLPDEAERRRMVKVLMRKEALLARLRVGPQSDVEALASYWGVGGRHKDVLPLLKAMQRVEGGTEINIICLLPHFVRDHLWTYPFATAGLDSVKQDCFWSAFNFFNGDDPVDRFNDMAYIREVLKKDYYTIVKPAQLGDLVLLSTRNDAVVHAAVYVADDLVFTKNGESYTQPWILMRMADMVDTYNVRYPTSGPLTTICFRLKSL